MEWLGVIAAVSLRGCEEATRLQKTECMAQVFLQARSVEDWAYKPDVEPADKARLRLPLLNMQLLADCTEEEHRVAFVG